MDNNTNREGQFQLTPAVIEANRNALQQLPLEELNEMIRIQEGIDLKKEVIDRIIENMARNYHPVIEERYQFVLWFYRIRTQYPQMGLFQPDFIWVIFRKMMTSKYNRSDSDIKKAVNDWCEDPVKATAKYGHISKWNTSLVTNMNRLFSHKKNFNDDISKWNVSNVTDMRYMFNGYIEGQEAVSAFNGDISKWNVNNVTTMEGMLACAVSFNGDISGWDVSNVTDMSHMFDCYTEGQETVSAFSGDISKWNVSKVTTMECMFQCAVSFNGDISEWDVSNVTNMKAMFSTAFSFNGDISAWNVSNVTDMSFMFDCYIAGQEDVSAFNGDISKWNVSKVTTMECMFDGAVSFTGDLSEWYVNNFTDLSGMFTDCPVPEAYKPNFVV